MATYVRGRMISTVALMAMVGIFVFLFLRLAPGDPAAMIAGRSATEEMIAGIREQLGLNDPLPVQLLALFIVLALAAPNSAGDPLNMDPFKQSPSAEIWFGSDNLGRDVLHEPY